MKKVNLLSKAEMKNVMGGNTSTTACRARCFNGSYVNCGDDLLNCVARDASLESGGDGFCSLGTTTINCNEVAVPGGPD